MLAVLLQRVHDGRLEVVDRHEVGEEGQDVFDLHATEKQTFFC